MFESKGRIGIFFVGGFLLLSLLFDQTWAQNPDDPFTSESLKLRTALHYDSAIHAPLEALVRLYTRDKREEELIGLYRAHIAQYPDDAGAKAVLAQILTSLERTESDEFIQSAARQHPSFSHLQYLLSASLKKKDETRSLEALSTAIDLENGYNRRSEWLGELLERSKTERGRELATAQLKKLLLVDGQTAPTMLSLGRVMLQYRFWDLGLEALNKAISLNLNPEEQVEADVLAARAEAALGKTIEAGKRLDLVLGKLAPDHPRRAEVMSQRVSVVASDEERLLLLAKAKSAYESTPTKETAMLDYAEILIAGGDQDEALKILQKASLALPESIRIEKLTLVQLEKRTNRQELIEYIASRLESHPERNDLRYRLVKAHHEKDDALAAEQDFNLVLASLEGSEKSSRILDLGRFLRAGEKLRLAINQYEAFLKLEPSRLDVTRELCEIYLKDGLEDNVKALLGRTSARGAEMENLLDLTQFLIDEQFYDPAEVILSEFIAQKPNPPFEPGLYLARVQSELGKRHEATTLLQDLREQTDSLERYKNWLNFGLQIHDNFDSLDEFFTAEQSLFNLADKDWTIDRIEKFLYLCEAGEKRQLAGKVAAAITQRLESPTIDPGLKIKLRQLLVRTLERDPSKAGEVEAQLKLLAREDPDKLNEYNLQLALIYHNVQRPDLAAPILSTLNLEKVTAAGLLRDSYRMLIEHGNHKLAGEALAVVTSVEPGDLFSWERRLSLLAAEGKESEFRAAIRSLLQGIAQRGKSSEWREDTRHSLNLHLLDSYWRSIADLIARDTALAECLPLLDAVEREAQGQDLLWMSWARAYVYFKLGREKERSAALNQLADRLIADSDAILSFPDGLTIPLAAAMKEMSSRSSGTSRTGPTPELPLLGSPKIKWGFEIDEGATILRVQKSPNNLMVLDDRGQVYRVDAATGKLIWKASPGVAPRPGIGQIDPENSPYARARKVRQMITSGNRFLLGFGNELRAYSCEDASLLWKTQLPPPGPATAASGPMPEMEFDGEGDRVILFDPATDALAAVDARNGKIMWEKTLTSSSTTTTSKTEEQVTSMNTGLSIKNGRILVFGKTAGIYEATTGDQLWGFSGEEVRVFPVTLREKQEALSDEEIFTLEQIKPQPLWTPTDASSRRQNLTYLSRTGDREKINDREVISFLNYPGSLLAPVVQWSKKRLDTGEMAHAILSNDYLWLMDRKGLKLISLNLPLASLEYDIQGTLVGEKENHAWILNHDVLYHIDGTRDNQQTISTRDLGPNVSGILVESRVFVRGELGVAVYNAITGRKISAANWDATITDYLAPKFEFRNSNFPEAYVWQGSIQRSAPGYPAYCYPPGDTVEGTSYYTIFEGNRIVAITD